MKETPPELVRLTQADADEAVAALCAAFADYPVMRYVLGDAGERYDERLADLIGFFCFKRLLRDWPVLGVRAAGDVAGVALVSKPGGASPLPEIDALRADTAAKIGATAWERLERYETESDKDAPGEPHYFLGVIGVRPEYQRTGVARILMDELARMSEADPESCGVCLNTESAANVAFYEHMGYRAIGNRVIDSLETWCMYRPNP